MVQFFLGDPQGYKKPVLPADARSSGVDIYIHAPYLINVATTNNRIRIPEPQAARPAPGGGGRARRQGPDRARRPPEQDEDPQIGFDNWRKVFERMECPIPVLIENTAGGDNAIARRLDRIARLWDALDGFDVGFCLDTCHAHAGGEDLLDLVDRVKAITGRIDLVHCNDSRDAFDSGADRHANLGNGQIDPS